MHQKGATGMLLQTLNLYISNMTFCGASPFCLTTQRPSASFNYHIHIMCVFIVLLALEMIDRISLEWRQCFCLYPDHVSSVVWLYEC